MNKRIVGFVLAMCLSLCFGAVSAFASYGASAYMNANNNEHNSTVKDSDGDTVADLVKKGFIIEFGSSGDRLSGRLSGVFSYFASTCIGYHQAGGTYTLYDSYGARATLTNNGGDHFVLELFYWRQSDLKDMQQIMNLPEDQQEAAWEQLYLKKGFAKEALQRIDYGKDGYPKGWKRTHYSCDPKDAETCTEDEYNNKDDSRDDNNYYYFKYADEDDKDDDGKPKTKYYKVEKSKVKKGDTDTEGDSPIATSYTDDKWSFTEIEEGDTQFTSLGLGFYTAIFDWLTQGQNYGVSVSVGDGNTGLRAAVSKDNKQLFTFEAYQNIGGSDTPGDDDPHDKLNGQKYNSVWELTYERDGEETKVKKGYNGIRITSEVYYNDDGMQYATVNYTFEFDSTDANSQNQQLGVNGQWKQSVTFINFDENGIRYDTTFNDCTIEGTNLESSKFTWTDPEDEDNKVKDIPLMANKTNKDRATSVTYYNANGSRYCTVDNTTGNTTYYANNRESYTINRQGAVVAMWQYSDNGILEAMWQSNNTSNDATSSETIEGTTIIYDYWGNVAGTFNDNYDTLDYFGSHEKAQKGLEVINSYKENVLTNGAFYDLSGPYAQIKSVSWTLDDILYGMEHEGFRKMVATGKGLFSQTDINNIINGNYMGVVAETEISPSDWTEKNVPDDAMVLDDATKYESKGTHKWHSVYGISGCTFKTKIKVAGTNLYETEANVVTDVIIESDPSAVGEYLGIEVGDDGKFYLTMSASEMNMYDGTGYQSADGEIIKVEITAEEAAKLKNLKKGTKIMINGDVTESHDGYMTMTHAYSTDSDYKGIKGIVVGDRNIAKEQRKIENLEYKFAQDATAANTITAAQTGTAGDWKAFWRNLDGGSSNGRSIRERENDPILLF